MKTLKNYNHLFINWQSKYCHSLSSTFGHPIFTLLIIFLLSISNRGLTQNYGDHQFLNGGQPTLKSYEKAARKAVRKKDFASAINHYQAALKLDKLKIENYYQLGLAARAYNANVEARNAFAMVKALDTLKVYEHYNESLLYYSIAEKNLGNVGQARIILEELPPSYTGASNKYQVVDEIADLNFIDNTRYNNEPGDVAQGEIVVDCIDSINTIHSEVSPVWHEGEGKLYYTSLSYERTDDRHSPARLYAKTLHSDLYNGAFPLEDLNIKNKTTAHFAFTPDDSRLYFTICDYLEDESSAMQCQIYFRDRTSNGWGEPIPLPSTINYPGFTTTHPAIGLNEKEQAVLYFTSDRPNGKGALDIWQSTILGPNNFGDPVNLSINTKENDITPFYHYSTNELYFSSEGHKSLGGYDIYKIGNNFSDGGWTAIEYLPEPLNSNYNDFDYFLEPDGARGFMVSSRESCQILENDQLACNDIFVVKHGAVPIAPPPCTTAVIVRLIDAETKAPLNGGIVTIRESKEDHRQENKEGNEFTFTDIFRDSVHLLILERTGYERQEIECTLSPCEEVVIEIGLVPIVPPPPPPPPVAEYCTNYFSFTVFAANEKKRLENAVIKVEYKGKEKILTAINEAGNYTFFERSEVIGYTLTVDAPGYETFTQTYEKGRCEAVDLTVPLIPKCIAQLAILVVDADTETSIDYAVVTIEEAEESHQLDRPNDGKRYVFTNIFESLRHTLTVYAEGYKPFTIECDRIEDCTTLELEVKLEKGETYCQPMLTIKVFDAATLEPIPYSTVNLRPISVKKVIEETVRKEDQSTTFSNEFIFAIDTNVTAYWVDVNHINYESLTFKLPNYGCQDLTIPIRLIEKPRSPFSDLLPIACFFENDWPKKEAGAAETYSSNPFANLYQTYHQRNGWYQRNFALGLSKRDATMAIIEVNNFFKNEVIAEYEKLEIFKDELYERLQKGETFTLSIRGYASNLAASDYNQKLGHRRVWSVKHYFMDTYGDLFKPYIDKQLFLKEIPIGEIGTGFDDPKDRRNAVYNPASARQRKAQIERVDVGTNAKGRE